MNHPQSLQRTALHFVLAATTLALAGCAPLNKDECRTANWQQIGYQDGIKGRQAARFEEERRACADHQIGADDTGWKIGYTQGLGVYCTAAHGYDVGRNGDSYGDVCPPASDALFRPAYEDGRRIASMASALGQRRSRMNDIGRQLSDDDKRARDYVNKLRDNPQPPPPPPQLLDKHERRDLEREYDQLQHETYDIRQDLLRGDGDLSARYAVPPMNFDDRN